ncbi:hypothetical protein [Sutcliffiella rhizosphaerae]|uniref:Uncharacterized protein n=1 Tax=Sutcliffiella rhizosphaerae TaxID=2880967 RepID=A0ABM8YQV4_9BACI|nr:hypothetical protein [Sutcliffiella rhizosphaerae]CAG9622381.1 hypothetical protein BACCIP111883_03172 [Sutcliffiella rhizosphaerae]
MTKKIAIPFKDIKSIHPYKDLEDRSNLDKRDRFDGVVADFEKEKPSIEIVFQRPLAVEYIFGVKKKVSIAHIRPDDTIAFLQTVAKKIE